MPPKKRERSQIPIASSCFSINFEFFHGYEYLHVSKTNSFGDPLSEKVAVHLKNLKMHKSSRNYFFDTLRHFQSNLRMFWWEILHRVQK